EGLGRARVPLAQRSSGTLIAHLRSSKPLPLRDWFAPIGKKKDDIMAEKSNETLRQQVIDHPEGVERNGSGPGEAQNLAGQSDPFQDPYLADPYPFFAQARAATPVFYSPDLDYWVVTRYHDIRHIFQTPKLFSAANTLAPLQPICPAAGRLLEEGG